MPCKRYEIPVLPILSYACEVWAVNPTVGQAAELLYRGFLKQLMGRMSVASEIVLAGFGLLTLQVHFCSRFCVITTKHLYQTILVLSTASLQW